MIAQTIIMTNVDLDVVGNWLCGAFQEWVKLSSISSIRRATHSKIAPLITRGRVWVIIIANNIGH